jgi:hypothetical protein
MRPVLIVPGIGNSGPSHWQSRWEALYLGVQRVEQRDWDHPVADEWVEAIEVLVRAQCEAPVLVAHSLGCLAVALWAARSATPAHALLLVSLPNPAGSAFPRDAKGFGTLPWTLRARPAVVVSSTDDPYGSPGFADYWARQWGASHERRGAEGHLNAASGLGDWPSLWARVEAWRNERGDTP